MDDRDGLIELSQKIGKHIPSWTQGAGGNFSVKINHKLWIKASGLRLDQVKGYEQLVEVDLTKLSQGLAKPVNDHEYAELVKQSSLDTRPHVRPSMEAGFHALLDKKWVMHFHSLAAVLMFEKNIPASTLQITSIPFALPGADLTWALHKAPRAQAYILQNHGVVLAVDDLAEIDAWLELEKKFISRFLPLQKALEQKSSPLTGPLKIYFPDTAIMIDQLLKILEPQGNGNYQLKAEAKKQDANAFEIWWATQLLWQSYPQLGELSPEQTQRLTAMPTEQFRKKLLQGSLT